jgi:hypothetical protein
MAASLFFSYSHKDESLRDQIETQLAMLKRQDIIATWHDRRIGAGEEIDESIGAHINADDIILLLVSSDFLASEYCYGVEMKRAMERHRAGDAMVIPVLLRACEWHHAPFGKLNATPPDGRPVTQYADRDQALLEVAKAIRGAAERVGRKATPTPQARMQHPSPQTTISRAEPRSSNLALAKSFTERDKNRFKRESFEYLARFFENSLHELAARNDGIEHDFRRIDADRFVAVIYKGGKAVSKCTVFVDGSSHMSGIGYSASDTPQSNSFNEHLSVDADTQSLFLRPLGLSVRGPRDAKLTQEGAAEFYWGMLVEGLQQR